jgi:predicted nucleotidyltransferase
MGTKELLKKKREEILSIAANRGAYNVRIFGSVVRDESGPSSALISW